MIATFFARSQVVEYLLTKIGHTVAVNMQRTEDGWTALMMASFFGYTEIVKALVSQGANLEVANAQGSTALMLATLRNHEEIVKILVQSGANVNAQNSVSNKQSSVVVYVYEKYLTIVDVQCDSSD